MTWRFQLKSLPDGAWIDRNVPLQDGQVTEAESAPAAITGYLPDGYAYRDAVQEWGALLIAEKEGALPVACIVDGVSTDGPRLKVEAGGFSMYPQGMPWVDADYSGIGVDPLAIVRLIWAAVQSKPGGNLGVVLDTTTSAVRLGTPEDPKLTAAKAALAAATTEEKAAKVTYTQAAIAKTAAKVALLAAAGRPSSGVVIVSSGKPVSTKRSTKNLWLDKDAANKAYVWNGKAWVASTASAATIAARLTDYNTAATNTDKALTAWKSVKKNVAAAKQKKSDISGGEAEPFTLSWWDTPDLGSVIDDLAKNTPFAYRERSEWAGEEITHRLELGTPALGTRRPDLRFEVGVNVKAPPPLQERDYASEVTVLGAGEGRKMVRATASGNPGRLRRAVVVQQKALRKTVQAAAAARAEVAARSAVWTFDTLDIMDHPHAKYGSFRAGDIVLVTGDAGWTQLNHWVRIIAVNTDCVTGAIDLKVEMT